MCLIAFAVNAHPDYKLILAANRDEFYTRQTTAAEYWSDQPTILGGRDLQAMGTWMAVNQSGRFGAVTNFRDLQNIRKDARSRGDLAVNYLNNSVATDDYLADITKKAGEYNGFNLLLFDGQHMHHFSNYEGKVNTIETGIHGVSNALLNTPWPKVEKLKKDFSEMISSSFDHTNLLELLANDDAAPDDQLPDTRAGHDLEKMLSPIYIKSEKYGTCCSTVLTISNTGEVRFTEKSFPNGNRKEGTVSFNFHV